MNVWETFRWNEASWFYFRHAAWNEWCHTRMSGPLWFKTLLELFSRACKTNTTPFSDSYAWHRVVCMIYEDRFSSSVLLQEESIHFSQQKLENNAHFNMDLRLAVTINSQGLSIHFAERVKKDLKFWYVDQLSPIWSVCLIEVFRLSVRTMERLFLNK